jgi:hypothetical protein
MPDPIPSFEDLVRRAMLETGLAPTAIRAILNAVLPLVVVPAAVDLNQALRQWKMYADMENADDQVDLDTDETVEAQLYRSARTTLAGIKALVEKGGRSHEPS